MSIETTKQFQSILYKDQKDNTKEMEDNSTNIITPQSNRPILNNACNSVTHSKEKFSYPIHRMYVELKHEMLEDLTADPPK